MNSLSYNYTMEESKPIFTSASDPTATVTTESFTPSEIRGVSTGQQSVFSPLAPPFQSRANNDLLNFGQQEPRAAEVAPPAANMDEVMMNFCLNGSDLLYGDMDQHKSPYFMGASRPESVASSQNPWGDSATIPSSRNGEMMDTFDFLIKSLSSANNYVSMLTREQLSVLRAIRPSLLYEFLQEVAKVRSDKRLRRALPNECAFCKNNGENEECYSSHALKDWRGRVLCPVLRAFRCPRCGATGDRAHTIKYCPENGDGALERSGSFSRRQVPSSLFLGPTSAGVAISRPAPATPASPTIPPPSPASSTAGLSHSSFWSSFGIN